MNFVETKCLIEDRALEKLNKKSDNIKNESPKYDCKDTGYVGFVDSYFTEIGMGA